jgi:hypothetical protein
MTPPLHLPHAVLEQARCFFEDRGAQGHEGTAMITGRPAPRLVIPDQTAHRSPRGGVSVEVTQKGRMQLAVALGQDERYAARIHSHPDEAFHSWTDDANPVLTYVGAISVVVPFYGLGLRHGLDACAVFRRTPTGWDELPVGASRERWISADHGDA